MALARGCRRETLFCARPDFLDPSRRGSVYIALPRIAAGARSLGDMALPLARRALHHPVFGTACAAPPLTRRRVAPGSRVKSEKSNTYGVKVVSNIIGGKARGPGFAKTRTAGFGKTPAAGAKTRPISAPAPAAARPQVRQIEIDEGSAGQRLDNFLLRELKGVPKTHVYRVIRAGEVRVNKGRAQADTRLELGDVVRVPPVRVAERAEVAAPAREFPIVYEDEQLLVVDKPAGVAVHGGSGVSFGVIEQLRRARPEARFLELVHRLDKETSGLLLLAKKRSALAALQQQFRERETGKTYAALVGGAWPAKLKVIDVALVKFTGADGERWVRAAEDGHADAKRSISLVRVARSLPGYSLLDVTIKTGRTHQIRVHLANAGHPIVGDPKYGDRAANRAIARGALRFERMFLHARELRFTHPVSGAELRLEAPLPPECEQLLARLQEADAPATL